jgi:hypothetical protein
MRKFNLSRLLLSALLMLTGLSAFAQEFPLNSYRSVENRLYWKNRPPYLGYWQQDVYYRIQAELNDKSGVITGTENLTYWNNSPDTLKFVYFHMYSNAFTPGSYSDKLYKANKIRTFYGPNERAGHGIEVTKMVSGGQSLKMEPDNTILKVYLDKPLPPNSEIKFEIDFKSYFDEGSVRRRMKVFEHNGYRHFDGVHWYPRISVYDRKQGWDMDQHLGREFYGDFGTFDVALTLPSNYVLDATGILINRDKVLPPELRQKLDIKNFASKPLNEAPTLILPASGTKTWVFHAMNVHDFAWTADPTYRIGESSWNGIQVITLAQEEHAGRWQTSAAFTAKVIEIYSKDFGMYEWPKIIVADAADGMEYPMLTLCGGLDPDYHYVIAHEVGHEWFFGMLGNNETYRAMMDEGFTQFLTAWSELKIDGDYEIRGIPSKKYLAKYTHPRKTMDGVLYDSYLRGADNTDNITINTHSDYFGSAIGHGGGYGQVYFKTGTMLYNLQYVLGDSLFKKAMQNYVSRWKICHPYVEDFEDAIIEYTHYNLKWFFDAWITTNKVIDYRVKSLKKSKGNHYIITFERKGGIQMPLDFTVYTKDGKKYSYYIPCSPDSKFTTATMLKPWIGWDKLNLEYKADIEIEGSITNVIIDTSNRMADVNMLDNQLRFPCTLKFDHLVNTNWDRTHYNMLWRPDIWYNSIDGIKAGLHVDGNYMGTRNAFWLTAWYNTGLLNRKTADQQSATRNPVSAVISYSNTLKCLDNDMRWSVEGRALDGLYYARAGISKSFRNDFEFFLNYKAMIRPAAQDLDYLLYPGQWQQGKWNNTLNAELKRDYNNFRSWGTYALKLRTAAPGTGSYYSAIALEEKHNVYIGKMLIRGRAIAEYMGGDVPKESELYLATASPEEMMDNKFTRSAGFFPDAWQGYGNTTNHFTYGGGLNLRGYSGYLAPEFNDTSQKLTYAGNAGAAVNLELDFSQFFNIHPKAFRFLSLNPYLFGDAGLMNASGNTSTFKLVTPRMDAGAGVAINIKSWGNFQKIQPLTIRFDVPLFLSNAPQVDSGNFMFRWMVGVNRAF